MNYNTDYCLLKVDKPSANTHRFAMFHIAVKEPNVLHIYRNNVDMTFQEIQVQLEQLGFDFSQLRVVAKDSGKPEVIYEGGKPDGMTLATAGHIDYLLTDMYSRVAMSYENQYGFRLNLKYTYDAIPYHFMLNSIQDASYRVKRTNISNNGVLKEEEIAKADMGFDLIYSVPKYLDENVAQEEREADKEEWKYWLERGKRGPRIVPIKNINILDVKPTESIKVVENKNLIQESPIESIKEPVDKSAETVDIMKQKLKEKMIKERDAIKTEKPVEVSDKTVNTVAKAVEPVVKSEPKTPVEPVVKSELPIKNLTVEKIKAEKKEVKEVVETSSVPKAERNLVYDKTSAKIMNMILAKEPKPKRDKDGKEIPVPEREHWTFSGLDLSKKYKVTKSYSRVTMYNPTADKTKFEVVFYVPDVYDKMFVITNENEMSMLEFKHALEDKYKLKFNSNFRVVRTINNKGAIEYQMYQGALASSVIVENKTIYTYASVKNIYLGTSQKIKDIVANENDLIYVVVENGKYVMKTAVTDETLNTFDTKADAEKELGILQSFFDVVASKQKYLPMKAMDEVFMNFPELAEKSGVSVERLTV